MMRIFDDSRSPFFKSAVTFTVGPIEAEDFERFIARRFRQGDREVDVATVRELIGYADAVSGDVQELCEAIWDTTAPGAKVTVGDIPRALDCVFAREGEAFGESVRQLTPLQVAVLRGLAELNPTGMRLIYQFGGRYRFVNPFFKAWLLKRM